MLDAVASPHSTHLCVSHLCVFFGTPRTYTEADFQQFDDYYFAGRASSQNPDFGPVAKAGMDSANPVSQTWWALPSARYVSQSEAGCSVVSQLKLPDAAHGDYGAPEEMWVNFTFVQRSSGGQEVEIELIWFNKTSTRCVLLDNVLGCALDRATRDDRS